MEVDPGTPKINSSRTANQYQGFMKRTSTIGGSVLTNQMGGMVITKNAFTKDHFKDGKNVRMDYKIERLVSSNSMGEVHTCTNHRTNAKRMCKTILKDNLDGRECESLRNEIRLLKTMDHPNMVTMYEVYQDKKKINIITEYLRGTELFDAVTTWNHFSETEAAVVMKQILSTMAYCHSNDIVHKDLRPENILVEGWGTNCTVKIIDFGYTRAWNRKTQKGYQGPPYYIAPELIKESFYDNNCDVWSCGIMFYVLLSG